MACPDRRNERSPAAGFGPFCLDWKLVFHGIPQLFSFSNSISTRNRFCLFPKACQTDIPAPVGKSQYWLPALLDKMLGALEVKVIARLAAQHGSAWKPLHSSVMACLLAHRNRRTGHCWPKRKGIAAYCNRSESTIDRAIARLTAWGAIEKQQPRAVSSQQFREAQYVFLFELPESAPFVSRASKTGGAVRQNEADPCVKNGGANKEEGKDLEQAKDQKGKAATAQEDSVPEIEIPKLQQAAVRVMEMIGMPITSGNQSRVEAGIVAEAKFSGRDIEETARAIAHAALDDQRRGVAINKWYFEDTKWRQGGSGNGRKLTQAERALDACEQAKANIRRRHGGG